MAHVTVHDGHPLGPGDGSAPDEASMFAAGRHRRGGRRARGRVVAAVVIAAVAAVGIVAAAAWATSSSHDRGAQAAVSEAAGDADAADWIRSNIPGDAKFLTNGHPAPAEYPSSPIDRPDQDWHAFDYLLTAPGADPPLDAAVAAAWQSSVPVAIFKTVQVRRILPTPPTETIRTREADRADRLVAGTALLGNPGVTASPQAQAILAAGGLDLRAAAMLTALAGSMPVYVANVEDVTAEAAAGMPARSMTVHVDDASRATTVISGMTAAFRAEGVAATPDGTFRLHWPLRFAPLPSVN